MTNLAELRILTLEAIVDHCRNGMPVPTQFETYLLASGRTMLTLRFNDTADVDAWARMLQLDDRGDRDLDATASRFRHYKAAGRGRDGEKAWLGWDTVQAEAFLASVAQVAEALLTDTTKVGA